MSFYHRYELVRLVQNGEPKTFEAREISSGREVLLHLWSMGDAAHNSELLLRLQRTMRIDPAALLGAVIEVQESAEPPYAVTAMQENFPGLEAWLDAKLSPSAAPPVPPPARPEPAPVQAPAPPPQGEFTRLFGAPPVKPEPPVFQPAAAQPPSAQPPPPQPLPAQPPPAQPPVGEFTRLFGAQPPPVEPPPPPALPAFDVAPPFGPTTPPAAPPKPPAPPPASNQPGEFTKLFGSPLGANPLPVEEIERGLLTPPPAPASERPFRGPSEFTIQFGHNAGAGSEGAPAPPLPPPEFNKNLAATGLFSVPVPEQHHAPPPAQPSGPGEFTRVMMRPASFQPQPPAAPPPVAPVAPPAAPGTMPSMPVQSQKRWLAPLIAVLTTLVVLLLIFVIVLLLKR